MDFASARTLGTGRLASAREMIEGKTKAKAFGRDALSEAGTDSGDDQSQGSQGGGVRSSVNDRPQGEVLEDPLRRQRILEAASLFGQPSTSKAASTGTVLGKAAPQTSVSLLGSALAKGPDGQPLIPISRKRRRKGPTQRERRRQRDQQDSQAEGSQGDNESSDFQDSSVESDDDSSISSASEQGNKRSEPPASAPAGHMFPSRAEGSDSASEPFSHSDHESLDTDSESEAVFLEAMRRRGLPLPSEDEEESDGASAKGRASDGSNTHLERAKARVSPSKGTSPSDGISAGDGSPPWQGFASEEDTSLAMSPESSVESSEEESTSEDEEEDAASQAAEDALRRGREFKISSRGSGFKDWARTALDSIYSGNGVGEARTEAGMPLQPVAGLSVKVRDMGSEDGTIRGPLGESEPATKLSPFAEKHYAEVASSKAVRNVTVQRTSEIIETRLRLPVVQEEDRIVRTILENQVTVICGETGSGKTTQVAQMLFERGFGAPGSGKSIAFSASSKGHHTDRDLPTL